MARGGGRVFSVDVENADLVRAIMGRIEDELEVYGTRKDGVAKTRSAASADLRRASVDIAERRIVPAVRAAGRSARTPQADKVAQTAKAKNDRLVNVTVGQATPRLSGFKRKRRNSRWASQVAFGAEYGSLPAGPDLFDAPRTGRGYFVGPAVEREAPRARDDYIAALNRLIERYARGRR